MTDESASTSQCYDLPHVTKFYEKDLDTLKSMVAGSNHTAVDGVADNWQWVHDRLVGGSDGGLKKEFDDAINAVLEHWSGAAAEGFRTRASLISTNISAAAPYAQNVSNAIRNSASSLKYYKQQLDAIQKPSGAASAMDAIGNYSLEVVTLGTHGGRDDSKANSELAQGVPTQQVLNGNSGELSEGKERQLQGAIVMEYLGGAYRSQAAAMGKPVPGYDESDQINPPGNTTPITPVIPVPVSVTNPKQSGHASSSTNLTGAQYQTPSAVESPRADGISGGIGKTPSSSFSPAVGTGLDGLPSGTGGTGGLGSGSAGGGFGGGTGSLGGGVGSVGAGGATSGGVGGGVGGIGAAGAAGAAAGRAGTGGAMGRGGAGAMGRAGAPGMGGAGGLGRGAGAGGAGGSGRGSLARQRGGVVGAAKGGASSGEQGGSGLHRSRGGTAAGKEGQSGRGMMGGAHGAHGKRDGQSSEGDRPDYLVEDEETWTPEQQNAPRVIE